MPVEIFHEEPPEPKLPISKVVLHKLSGHRVVSVTRATQREGSVLFGSSYVAADDLIKFGEAIIEFGKQLKDDC